MESILSNYLSWQAATALGLQEREHLTKYITAQMYYSLVGRELEHEFVSFAEYHRMGILVWSPLAGGFLSGKYDRQRPPPPDTRFADAGRFVPFDLERGYRIIEALKAVAERHAATPAQIALAWLLSHPVVSSVIVAARTNERLAENVRAVEVELSPLLPLRRFPSHLPYPHARGVGGKWTKRRSRRWGSHHRQ